MQTADTTIRPTALRGWASAFAAIALVTAGCVSAPPALDRDDTFGFWDADADARLTTQEIEYGFGEDLWADRDVDADGLLDDGELAAHYGDSDLHADWDTDGDSYLGDGEMLAGVWESWDFDGDGVYRNDELAAFASAWDVSWSDWDRNADAALTRSELESGFAAAGVFEEWDGDADGRLTRSELSRGYAGLWRDRWDSDRDAFLSRRELSRGLLDTWDFDGSGDLDSDEFSFANVGRWYEI